MNKFKYYFILIITTLSLFSCSKSDTSTTTFNIRDYAVQNTTDKITIEDYLNNFYIKRDNPLISFADQDIKIEKITDVISQPSIMSYLNSSTFPKLLSRDVHLNDVKYTLYYLVLREGNGESPCNVDNVLTAYSGQYLQETTSSDATTLSATTFEVVKYPQQMFSLYSVIKGWSEILPKFKTGDTPISNSDGTITYNNFGAGVIFIPSGLGYYANGSGSIPSYAPLVFSFKLYGIQRLDQDADGIPSYLEDQDGDGYMYDYRNLVNYPTTPATNIDDTDKDGIPNFLDVDDDGDNYTTKFEITKLAGSAGPSKYYPYNAFLVPDDPLTAEDESLKSEPKGIPAFVSTGVYDYTSSDRVRIHLDKAHH